MGLTTDRNDECLNVKKDNGQNECYLVLTEEERSKGYVRPFRTSYIHRGRFFKDKPIMKDEQYVHDGEVYVATIPVLYDENGTEKGHRLLTQKEVDDYNRTGGYIGGCSTLTTMNYAIAETYAVNPSFYGATFCCGCGEHLPVIEFEWLDGKTVGS